MAFKYICQNHFGEPLCLKDFDYHIKYHMSSYRGVAVAIMSRDRKVVALGDGQKPKTLI
jgi:hypothetical protein